MRQRSIVARAVSALVVAVFVCHSARLLAQQAPTVNGEPSQALRDELAGLLAQLATVAERDTMGGRMGYAGQSPTEAIELSRTVRFLAALPPDQRYDVLKEWMFPSGPRALPRFAMCFAPVEPPPEYFFSEVSIPNVDSHKTPATGIALGSDAVIYYSELLVAAAVECGRLEELAAVASRPSGKSSQMVETLSLITILASTGNSPLAQQARDVVAAWRRDTRRPDQSQLKPWPTYLIARAWMARDDFRDAGEQLAGLLLSKAATGGQPSLLSCLLRDQAWCRVRDSGGTLAAGTDPGLSLWHPGGYYYHSGTQAGTWPGWWVEHDGMIAHLSGPEVSPLYLDVPLQGEFELAIDGFAEEGAEAAVQYGRFLFEPRWRNGKACVLTVGEREFKECPDVTAPPGPFNQIVIRVNTKLVSYLCNGKLMYEDEQPSPTTPWLALIGRSTRRTEWCNVHMTGSPRIPSEVSLISGPRMDGWMSPLYREPVPRQIDSVQDDAPSSGGARASVRNFAWYALDGVLYGTRRGTTDRSRAIQSWLAYHRPLREGETLSYEFFYDPAEKMVYPSLGRTALLLEPDGVRLHWITDIPHMAIGGLAADNAVAIPQSQRGPKPLPLRPGQWNHVTINVTQNSATVLLNGTEVYEHPLNATDNRMFGLFRYSNRTSAEVRNIVLHGNWPANLTAQQMAHLMMRREGTGDSENEQIRAALVDQQWIGQKSTK